MSFPLKTLFNAARNLFSLLGGYLQPPEKRMPAKSTFSNLPAEIQVGIAEYCANSSLINLCLTSKQVNERCLWILYRHVDLQFHRYDLGAAYTREHWQLLDALLKRQKQFVRTMLSHPRYGKYVRSFKGSLCIPIAHDRYSFGEDTISEEELWRALRSFTQIRSVDIASKSTSAFNFTIPTSLFPKDLFGSATSVRLVGRMQFGLAKSILDAINPATLNHLCIDMAQDGMIGHPPGVFEPGERGEDGRMIALGALSGLLTTLTGRCSALRTLTLRRIGQVEDGWGWHAEAEEEAYMEWVSFIRSVRGTVEDFTFEQAAGWLHVSATMSRPGFRIMDDRFRRHILPALVSESWPCLTNLELRGVRNLTQGGQDALITELRAVLGRNTEIVVEEEARYEHDSREPDRWN